MTTQERTPPPSRPPKGLRDDRWWRWLLTCIREMWQRLNRDQFSIGEVTIYTGAGTPENNQAGSVGDVYLRTDGSTGTTMYIKESGSDTDTGWSSVS